MRRLLVVAVAVSLAIPMVANPASGATCTDVLGLWARGSGRPQALGNDTEGRTWRDSLEAQLPRATVDVEAVVFPAAGGIDDFLLSVFPWGAYRDSMRQGRDWVRDRVRQANQDCPNQKIVLGGFSQGAHSITDALLTNADLWGMVDAVTLFGSPIHNDEPGLLGPADAQRVNRGELYQAGTGILGQVKWNDNAIGKVQSWCIRFDPVCDAGVNMNNHVRYDNRGYIDDAVTELARENLPQFRNGQVHPSCGGQEADIALGSEDDRLEITSYGYDLNGVGMTARSYDRFASGPGNDTIQVWGSRSATVFACGESGADIVAYVSGDMKVKLYGGSGNDTLTGGPRKDTIKGGGGKDLIHGAAAGDKIYGGGSADEIYGGGGSDTIYGGGGKDYIEAGSGADTIDGGANSDTILAGGGDDVARGGGGDDAVYGGNGTDTVDGGFGTDIVFGDAGASDICISGLQWPASITGCEVTVAPD